MTSACFGLYMCCFNRGFLSWEKWTSVRVLDLIYSPDKAECFHFFSRIKRKKEKDILWVMKYCSVREEEKRSVHLEECGWVCDEQMRLRSWQQDRCDADDRRDDGVMDGEGKILLSDMEAVRDAQSADGEDQTQTTHIPLTDTLHTTLKQKALDGAFKY